MNMDTRYFEINDMEFKIEYSFVELGEGEEVLSELFKRRALNWKSVKAERGPCKEVFALDMIASAGCEVFK